MWQTIPGAGASNDGFEVDYSIGGLGATTTIASTSISTISIGVENRVNHYVNLTGLNYDEDYF